MRSTLVRGGDRSIGRSYRVESAKMKRHAGDRLNSARCLSLSTSSPSTTHLRFIVSSETIGERELVCLRNQLVERELIVFIALLLRVVRIYVNAFECSNSDSYEGARLRSKEIPSFSSFSSAVLSSHAARIFIHRCECVQSLLFLSSQQCPPSKGEDEEEREREKKRK